jgi:hypothetical protein
MSNVIPLRPREVVSDPSDEALEQLEVRVRQYFRYALESAMEETWRDAHRSGGGSMSVDTLGQTIGRAIKAETARFWSLQSQ